MIKKVFLFLLACVVFVLAYLISFKKDADISVPSISEIPTGWVESQNSIGTFYYPADFDTKYIKTVDWPPLLLVIDEKFECSEAGMEFARAGVTQRDMVDGREYCVTRVSEGAAGSIYTSYAYAFSKDDKMVILTFSLKSTQCDSYDEVQASECKTEREKFNPIGVIDSIAHSLILK